VNTNAIEARISLDAIFISADLIAATRTPKARSFPFAQQHFHQGWCFIIVPPRKEGRSLDQHADEHARHDAVAAAIVDAAASCGISLEASLPDDRIT
jgi:hypothetical protein